MYSVLCVKGLLKIITMVISNAMNRHALKLACDAISADVVYRVQEACARPRVLRVFLFSEKGRSK